MLLIDVKGRTFFTGYLNMKFNQQENCQQKSDRENCERPKSISFQSLVPNNVKIAVVLQDQICIKKQNL